LAYGFEGLGGGGFLAAVDVDATGPEEPLARPAPTSWANAAAAA